MLLGKFHFPHRWWAILPAAGFLCLAFNSHSLAQDRGQTAKPSSPIAAEPRLALVIGNSAYKGSPLSNPVNDARDMAALLRQVGFKVIAGENMTQAETVRAIGEFGQNLRRGGVGLFYFAGHGMQVRGENYLIPVNAEINKELDVEVEAVKLARVLNEMEEAKNRLNLVILDACRNNPFARSFRSGSNGLSSVNAPTGTLIAYATSPGSTASDGAKRNGLYTEELLAAIRTPGLKVEDVFKRVRTQVRRKSGENQVPWESSSLEGDFYFVPDASQSSLSNAITPPSAQPASQPGREEVPSAPPSTQDGGRWIVIADKRIDVAADEAWTDTGIQVQSGQYLTLRASGPQVNLGNYGYAGPRGVSRADARKPSGDCPTGALLARLGAETICIEAERSFTAKAAGKLQLGLNESNLSDNQGTLVVKVVVQEYRR